MVHVGLHDFLQFAAYYIILKTAIHVGNLWARRNSHATVASVTGLMA